MEIIGTLVVLVIDVYALLNIWKSDAETQKQVIWTIVVLVFPVLGAIIWFFAGPKASGKLF